MAKMNGAVRLRWSSHQNTVMAAVDHFFGDESLVDVTLSCEGKTLQAHKLILCACSPYLKKLLDTKERVDPIIFFTGVKFAHLKTLIQFIYRGEVNISQNDLPSFLTLADELQIRGLANQGDSSTESATQRIRSTILDTNKNNSSDSTDRKTIPKVNKLSSLSRPLPPLKRARSSIASDEDINTTREEIQNGIVLQHSESADSDNVLSPEEELKFDGPETPDRDEECDEEAIVEEEEIDATDGAGGIELPREQPNASGLPRRDWKELLNEDDSDEQLSISDPDQYTTDWGFGDGDGDGDNLEMTLDDDEDDIQEVPSTNSRSSSGGNDIEPSWCPLCNKQFLKRKTWNTHCLYDCPMVPPKYSCPNCEYRARRGYQLKIHCLKIHGIVT